MNTETVIGSLPQIDVQTFMRLANNLFQGAPPWEAEAFDKRTARAEFQRLHKRLTGIHRNPFRERPGGDARRQAVARAIAATMHGIAEAVKKGNGPVPIEIERVDLGLQYVLIHRRDTVPEDDYRIEVVEGDFEGELYAAFINSISGLDARRIKRCVGCSDIFWANRRHKRVCSDRCRLADWRENNPVRYAKIQDRYEAKRKA